MAPSSSSSSGGTVAVTPRNDKVGSCVLLSELFNLDLRSFWGWWNCGDNDKNLEYGLGGAVVP